MTLKVQAFDAPLGAEVAGVDLSAPGATAGSSSSAEFYEIA